MSDTFVSGKNAGGGLPVWMGIMILAISFAIMFWYFVWYPRRVALQLKHTEISSESRIQIPES
jgi:hypothetical protein